jgi:transposase-like protein
MVHTPAATRWSEIIDQQEASGQSVQEFAAAHDLNRATLAWWRSRLGRSRRRSQAACAPERPVFDQLAVVGPQQTSAPEVPLVEGTVVIALERLDAHVVVDRETNLRLLRQVLDALC